ncbi:MAG: DEAD/DEAH box helicase [Lactobacillus sp.]|nr:DEAD/DEAH box helicase [Lactobacillus sp.]
MYQAKIQELLNLQKKTKPTLIQERTFDLIKDGSNLVAYAKTGTGKTLAYGLPALEKVVPGEANSLVIFLPTTELAVQVRNALNPFIAKLGLKGITLVGAGNRSRQEERLKKLHPEVLVCTPGRFFDFFSSGRIKKEQIKMLVIDEADDLLEFTKLELLTSLGQNLNSDSQIILFGATDSQLTDQADEIFMRNFVEVDVRPEQKLPIQHYFLQVDNRHKVDFVQRLIKLPHFHGIMFFDSNQALLKFAGIFGHTKTKFAILSTDFGKQKREEALRNFRNGDVKLLLATDLAARGLDIPGLTYVVNFEIPADQETYTHRSGRVGRMNNQGTVVTLGNDHDLRNLEKLIDEKLIRVYFDKSKLSTKMPKKTVEAPKTNKPKKKKKRKNKNKGYHPHFLKEKK